MVVWQVRAGKEAKYSEEFVKKGIIAIGFGDLPDLSKTNKVDSIRDAYNKANPKRIKRIMGNVFQIYDFVNNISEGEEVVMPLRGSTQAKKGRITSKCKYDPAAEYRHFRKIKWYNKIYEREEILKDSSSVRFPTQTVARIWNNQRSVLNYERGVSQCLDLLNHKSQIIIQGPPGTGKTILANIVAKKIASEDCIQKITFHQSYSYEDFIEGLNPIIEDAKLMYEKKDGILKKLVDEAIDNDDKIFVLLIDEINRANISKVFGEIITLIEEDKRNEEFAVILPYSRKKFFIPKNLKIIGTMNTADRSLINIDAALKRRFSFYTLDPDPSSLSNKISGVPMSKLLNNINKEILKTEVTGKQIGHSYFHGKKNIKDLRRVFQYEIIPLLEDYFMDRYYLLKNILGDGFVDDDKKRITKDWIDDDNIFIENISKIARRSD